MNPIALLLGGKAGAAPEEDDAPAEPADSPERMYAREAFGALKDDDEDGFVSAFLGAVKACGKKKYAEPTEPDADDME